MTIKPQPAEEIPEETRVLAWQLCPKGTVAMHLRDALGPIYQDEDFLRVYPKWGKPSYSVWRLALITILQTIEGLTDRQAAQAMEIRLDWRYALSLPLSYSGIDFTILSDFRERLVSNGATELLLQPILDLSRERGWLKAGGKQRTDSTMVLARIRSLNSLESVGEGMRASLNAIASQDEEWLWARVNPEWFDRYVHRFELARFPKEESKRERLREQVGEDALELLGFIKQEDTPAAIKTLGEVQFLERSFAQHYEIKEGKAHWRAGPVVTSADRVISPYDPEARSSRKRETKWVGYKVHLSETCDQDPNRPQVITNVYTSTATEHDSQALETTLQQRREKGLAPAQEYVDQGYPSGTQLVKQRALGTEIVGPVPAEGGWQVHQPDGYSLKDFEVNWQTRQARCPQGQTSLKWSARLDTRGQPVEFIRFPKGACQHCPVRDQCTTAEQRTLTLNVQGAHEALEVRRKEQFEPDFQQRYGVRAGIEGTMSQATRAFDLRQTPYMGLDKTHLHHVCIATGLNLMRIHAHIQAQAIGKPTRPSRPLTPFARLQQRHQAISA
jgi:transposase